MFVTIAAARVEPAADGAGVRRIDARVRVAVHDLAVLSSSDVIE